MLLHKHKTTIIAGILFLTLLIMFTNFSDRKDYDSLDNTVSSIYNDRLIPAGLLFEINTHLYNRKTLIDSEPVEKMERTRTADNSDIQRLIAKYEKTYLTAEEKKHWLAFRSSLNRFYNYEMQYLNDPSAVHRQNIKAGFFEIETHLQQLNSIQASEGKKLQAQSLRIIDNTRLSAWFESALLFLICIAILRWGGVTEKYNLIPRDRAVLN